VLIFSEKQWYKIYTTFIITSYTVVVKEIKRPKIKQKQTEHWSLLLILGVSIPVKDNRSEYFRWNGF
jgi:hypothetical protein